MKNILAHAITIEGVSAIATVLATIVAILTYFNINLRRNKKQLEKLNPNLEVLANYRDVWNKAVEILLEERNSGNEIVIKNIGLDLEKILPDIKEFIDLRVKNDLRKKFHYIAVMINPDSSQLQPLINGRSNLKTEYVIASKIKLAEYTETLKNNSAIKLEASQYNIPPVIHGLEINGKHLLFGFTEIQDGKIFGSECPYLYLKYDVEVTATSHYFRVFNSWFEYYRTNGN